MSKIISNYENDLDKAWYSSSNILYSECDDKDGELKQVRITFKGGRTYLYEDVKVNDYLMFREASSQGKALNEFIKQYKTSRIEDADTEKINQELQTVLENNTEPYVEITETSISFIEKNQHILNDNIENEKVNLSFIIDLLNKFNIKIVRQ